jgi:hypothetical protein
VKNNSPTDGDIIVFTDILLNLGDSYNTNTGIYTVPLGGIYLFTVQLCIDNSEIIHYELVVDDKTRCQDNIFSEIRGKKSYVDREEPKFYFTVTHFIGYHSPEFLFLQINSIFSN